MSRPTQTMPSGGAARASGRPAARGKVGEPSYSTDRSASRGAGGARPDRLQAHHRARALVCRPLAAAGERLGLNDTDLTFEAGAVTFFEGSTSLGEGILGHTLPPGGQEVVPYAVDASVDVTPKISSRQEPYIRGTVADGVLQLTRVDVLASTWTLVNRGKEKATLWHQPDPLYS
jgi:hypothetical protein